MKIEYSDQRIVLKGFLAALLTFSLLLPQPSYATGKTNLKIGQNISGAELLQKVNTGQIPFNQAASFVSQQGKLPIGNSSQVLKSLQSGIKSGKFDIGSAGNFLNGALDGTGNLNIKNIGNATQMVQNLQAGKNISQVAGKLLSNVGKGGLAAGIGKELSKFNGLGNLAKPQNIANMFKNPGIANGLQSVFNQKGGLGQAAGTAKNAAGLVKNIANIADIISNPQALQSLGTQLVAGAVTQALQQAIPNLVASFGGPAALQGAIGKALGGQAPSAPQQSQQQQSCGASCTTCSQCAPKINTNHRTVRAHVTSEFEQHRNWIVTTYFLEHILPSMMLMTEQFTANMMLQVQIIGGFFDAKHQLETQRLFQQMTAKAHKDYHPSESMCTIGTNVRSLAASEKRSSLTQVALANRMLARQLSNGDSLSTEGITSDIRSRITTFIEKFCDKTDQGGGLSKMCKDANGKTEQINMDVDFTNAFENKLTLKMNFTNDGAKESIDQENIFALSTNLFGHNILPTIPGAILANNQNEPYAIADWYMDLRAIAAKRSVAQNSFAAIAALKTEGDNQAAPFLKAVLVEAGINPKEVEDRLGEKPSYFAQMEILTKDLYQNPTFYANLYDKPVNIERKATALQAIELMQDRDIYKSLLRSEAVLATLIETLLHDEHRRVSRDLGNVSSGSSAIKGTGGSQ